MRYLTAGESHGKGLTVILEGVPANIPLTAQDINQELAKRQQGYGRGGRMKIETDQVDILSGIRHGKTLGSPLCFLIPNRDWVNWETIMNAAAVDAEVEAITAVRPGHADLPGMLKYQQADLRNILERSSARETAARVCAGAVAKKYLSLFGINCWSHVCRIGHVAAAPLVNLDDTTIQTRISASQLRCLDPNAELAMIELIDRCRDHGVTLGGIFEVVVDNVPPGLGSHVQWDRKLDGRIAQAILGIQAIKGIEFGLGFEMASLTGDLVHDEIFYTEDHGYYRRTNRAGGIEGGMTNGEPIVFRAVMKPIPTMRQPLKTVDIGSKIAVDAHFERSDNCAVPAAAVVAENITALALMEELQLKLGGDYLEEQLERFEKLKRI